MSYVLGIDVGTTRSAAAIGRPGIRNGEIEIVNLGDRSNAVPSVLYVGDDGGIIVGEAAERRAVTDPDRVVREFKRRIGDPTPVVIAGRPWAPEELSARLVRWVVDRVAQREGGTAGRLTIAHPAAWGAHKKDLLGGALGNQGLPVTFIAEPQAAALHYASAERVEPGSTIAVYDFGGGTFDAAVVHKEASGGFSLLGRPEGLDRLGGIDFDEVVFEHVREGLPEAFEGLDENDPAVLAAVAAVRRECSEAKEALSSDIEVSIPVLMPGARGSVRLHRGEFEAMIRNQVEETVAALRRAVVSAGCTPDQLSAVLLVGGSSRIPLVGQLVPAAVPLTGAPAPAPRGAGNRHSIGPGAAPGPFHQGGPSASGPYNGPVGTGANAPYPAPPTQRLAGTGSGPHRGPVPPPPPPRRQSAFPDRPAQDLGDTAFDHQSPDIEYGRERSGRSPALLVSAGGAAAAVAVIAAVFLWPDSSTATTPVGVQLPSISASTPEPTPVPETEKPTPTTKPHRPEVTTAPPVPTPSPTPPPVTTTPPPTATTTPTSTAPPTTTPPTKTTDPGDPQADAF